MKKEITLHVEGWKAWVILAVILTFVVSGVVCIMSGSEKEQDNTEIFRLKNEIKVRDAGILEIQRKVSSLLIDRRQDSINTVQKLDSAELVIVRLERRMKSINTKKATARDLDSILIVLYP